MSTNHTTVWPSAVPTIAGQDTLHACDVDIDRVAHRVWVRGEPVDLALREFQLLEVFIANADKVLSRERIIEWLWGDDPSSNSLSVHILRLRHKIEADPAHPERIKTVRGLGYRFESQCSAPSCRPA